jgi:hypothetical protein
MAIRCCGARPAGERSQYANVQDLNDIPGQLWHCKTTSPWPQIFSAMDWRPLVFGEVVNAGVPGGGEEQTIVLLLDVGSLLELGS